jgi:Fe-S-cluster-containing dehydrogenase component
VSLAITQDHAETRGRSLALLATAAEYAQNPELTRHVRGPQPSLLPVHATPPAGVQWAMTIDTSICTGCSSCVVACQAENNVPVVGREEVERGREMHWLRIDRYVSGPVEAPRVVQQPMLCQHCEAAPCEYVCPVNATVHSPDGLNEMVYNRCIGTRFCSNNCPYKVRRFNWFEYTDNDSPVSLQRNPDVTVRERGVMEKCTYCVQRIRRAEMAARTDERGILPGEVVTACQQACPTQAIQFGALEHAGTPMVEWRKEGRAYAALHDLGTRPRTLYLAKIQNLNPELEG